MLSKTKQLCLKTNNIELNKKNINTTILKSKGFTLVEVLVALFVMLVGLTSAFALFAAATALHKRATDYSTAAVLSDSIFSEIASKLTTGVQVGNIARTDSEFPGYTGYKYSVELIPVDSEDEENANEFFVRLIIRWQKQGRERDLVFTTIMNRRIPFKGREYYKNNDN